MDTQVNYTLSAGVYSPNDAKGLLKTAMRDYFKNQGKHFNAWKEQVVVKIGREDFLEIVDIALKEAAVASEVNQPQILHSHVTPYSIEFSVSPDVKDVAAGLFTNHDVVRVYVDINYNEDGYNAEPDSAEKATEDILIAHMEVYGCHAGTKAFVTAFRDALRAKQKMSKSSLVNWIFVDGHGASERTFHIKKDWTITNSYYPWIDTDLHTYYKSFMESKSQILVLYGPPGTGKTSFIRDLICEMNLNAYISYDMKILTSDSTFVNYVTGSIFDAIIIEDADDLLTADRDEQNKVIAKILNVSDGLIKLPKKKLIFSTNLDNVADIDPAIIRPGRCFDVMEFRDLTKKEAVKAATDLGVSIDDDKNNYSLAELFFLKNMKDSTDPFTLKHNDGIKKRKFGFI